MLQALNICVNLGSIIEQFCKVLLCLGLKQVMKFNPVLRISHEPLGVIYQQMYVIRVSTVGLSECLYLIAELAEKVVSIGYRDNIAFPV